MIQLPAGMPPDRLTDSLGQRLDLSVGTGTAGEDRSPPEAEPGADGEGTDGEGTDE